MYKIGEFAMLSRVPVKTLRYYDEIGLLKPVHIDRFTRYRYYAVEQLTRLNRILVLKELGFSLEQINQLVQDSLTPDQMRGMLRLRRAEIEQQVQAAQAQLSRLEARLSQIEREGKMPPYEIVLKHVRPQWVVAVPGSIPTYDQSETVFDHLFDQVSTGVRAYGLRPSGPGLAIYHESDPEGSSQVEAAFPIGQKAVVDAPLRCYQLEEVKQMACVVHHGSFGTLGQAYQALLGWMEANRMQRCGPARELYLKYARGGDPSHYVTEIQFPVRTTNKEHKLKEPKFVTRPPFLVAGLRYLGKNEHDEIGQVWDAFLPRIPEIAPRAAGEQASYGLCIENPTGLIDYTAGLQVSSLEDLPEGMQGAEVPEQTYAVFPCQGIREVSATYEAILKEWLPGSGWQFTGGPDFEYYPPTFRGRPEDALEIYFPVKKK